MPGFDRPDPKLLSVFPVKDLLKPLWPLIALMAGAALRRDGPSLHGRTGFYAALVAGSLGLGWILRTYPGAYDNVLMPAHAVIAIGAALAFWRLTSGSASTMPARAMRWSACALVAFQLVLVAWDPARQIPRPEDREVGDAMVAAMRGRGARTFVPTHPYLAKRAGLPYTAHIMPLMDVIRDGHGPRERKLLAELQDSLRARVWKFIVFDNREWIAEEVWKAGYKPYARRFEGPDLFWPVTGMRTRPEWVLFVPDRSDSGPAGLRPSPAQGP